MAPSVGDHFLYSCDLNVCFRNDTVGRNKMLNQVALSGLRVKQGKFWIDRQSLSEK